MPIPAYLRAFTRRLIACTLYYTGLLWLLAAVRLHNKAVVLMYHRILPADSDSFSADGIVVRPRTFARQMKFIRRHFRVLSVDQLREYVEKGAPIPSKSCAVTFDDGWADNYRHALPVLREHRVPATFFVATNFISTQDCFWQERVSWRMFQAVQQEGPPRRIVERYTDASFDNLSPAERRSMIHDAVNRMKTWPAHDVEALENELDVALEQATADYGRNCDDVFMSWAELTEVAREVIASVGGHGCSHTPLTALSDDLASRELSLCRQQIESHVGVRVLAIAYPNGNFDNRTIALARKAGYRIGFTTLRGVVDTKDDSLSLRRINIHESATRTMPEFLCTMLGVFRRYQPLD